MPTNRISASRPGHHGRERHILRRALACGSALTAATALACAGATVASAATGHSAGPASHFLAGHPLSPAVDGPYPAYNVQLIMDGTNLCLDAENDSGGNPSQNGDKVQLWTCNSGADQQLWYRYDPESDGYYVFTNEYTGSGLSLGADTGGTPDCGDQIQLQEADQTWLSS